MLLKCIKEVYSGYVPVTHYKEGDIVEANYSNWKYYDKNTKSELNMKCFKTIIDHRDNILNKLLR